MNLTSIQWHLHVFRPKFTRVQNMRKRDFDIHGTKFATVKWETTFIRNIYERCNFRYNCARPNNFAKYALGRERYDREVVNCGL